MNREELLKNAKQILFNTEMVQAILEGRKTVTRRIIKHQPGNMFGCPEHKFIYDGSTGFYCSTCGYGIAWPHMKYPVGTSLIRTQYKVGDIIYVRETFCENGNTYLYKAGCPHLQNNMWIKWHPSLHMPKEAARIFLKATDVRVERLQDITEEQAKAEGTKLLSNDGITIYTKDYKTAFSVLWNSTIKKQDLDKYGWEANPWVWVIEFEREVAE